MNKAGVDIAKRQRDHVRFSRRTVWNAITVVGAGGDDRGEKVKPHVVTTWQYGRQCFFIALAATLCGIVLASNLFGDDVAKRRCLALLLFVCTLWGSEAIPLYATALCVPFVCVTFRVFCVVDPVTNHCEEGHQLTAVRAAGAVCEKMLSPAILLLLGGFTLAAALTKTEIAKRLAGVVLGYAGESPSILLLCIMLVSWGSSTCVTNIAAPPLCFGLLSPLFRPLGAENPLCRALVMGIAVSANLGGMTTPIASPQNIFAIQAVESAGNEIGWLQWLAVSIPVSFLCLLVLWRVLLRSYGIDEQTHRVRPLKLPDVPVTPQRVFVLIICVITIVLWCADSEVRVRLGQPGITALIPIVVFYGTGILDKADFHDLPWTVVVLALGGSVLAEAVSSSGLLKHIAEIIAHQVAGASAWELVLIFSGCVGFTACFISSTVTAMVVLPVIQHVGTKLAETEGADHSRLLVVACALMCSGGMALSISSFPNMMSATLTHVDSGLTFVSSRDFFRDGGVAALLCFFMVNTLGYGIMMALDF